MSFSLESDLRPVLGFLVLTALLLRKCRDSNVHGFLRVFLSVFGASQQAVLPAGKNQPSGSVGEQGASAGCRPQGHGGL